MALSSAPGVRPWQDVLDFWFLPAGTSGHLTARQAWFRKDPAFDDEIRTRFEPLIRRAIAGELQDWEDEPRGALARILLLDQFTRNIWRDTPQAFSGDAAALAGAQRALDAGHDQAVSPVERAFFYLPFEHSEDLADQDRGIALYTAAGDTDGLKWAKIHHDIIARFGRFPHRNAVLGRATTAEEQAFLDDGGFAG